ncbi:hypothetical protein HDU98_004146 [Podochytrium sp. JEL0797]|nr:hypothetical protein HDU98_004146 [Podochytrium sp. JEL0797]
MSKHRESFVPEVRPRIPEVKTPRVRSTVSDIAPTKKPAQCQWMRRCAKKSFVVFKMPIMECTESPESPYKCVVTRVVLVIAAGFLVFNVAVLVMSLLTMSKNTESPKMGSHSECKKFHKWLRIDTLVSIMLSESDVQVSSTLLVAAG